MENLVFDNHPITHEAYCVRIKESNEKLSRIPTRIFQKLFDNLNQTVDFKELLEYAHQQEMSEDLFYYKMRSLDVMLTSSIKPFAEKLGLMFVRTRGKGIMLIK